MTQSQSEGYFCISRLKGQKSRSFDSWGHANSLHHQTAPTCSFKGTPLLSSPAQKVQGRYQQTAPTCCFKQPFTLGSPAQRSQREVSGGPVYVQRAAQSRPGRRPHAAIRPCACTPACTHTTNTQTQRDTSAARIQGSHGSARMQPQALAQTHRQSSTGKHLCEQHMYKKTKHNEANFEAQEVQPAQRSLCNFWATRNQFWIGFGHKVKGRGIGKQGKTLGRGGAEGARRLSSSTPPCSQAQTGWQGNQ
eukprot:1146236-Pelagomonas_calceolata.AAC.1